MILRGFCGFCVVRRGANRDLRVFEMKYVKYR
jgi:hypothetical protein